MSANDKNSETIKQKMDKLSELVQWFDGPEFSLEQAVERFGEAEKLATEIERDLKEFKNDITVLKERFDQAN